MRVAWLCEYPPSGFPDRAKLRRAPPSHPVPWVTTQAPLVAASGIDLHIVTVSKHVDADDAFTSGGVHFHFLKVPRLPRAALAYQLDRRTMTRCLRRIQPAIVHGFGTESSFGYTAVSAPYPSVLMIQGIISRITRALGLRAIVRNPGLCVPLILERVAVRRSRHVICETAFAGDFVREHNPRAVVHLIRTPVRDGLFDVTRQARVDAPEVLFLGSVIPAKGVEVLIEAFSRLLREFPQAVLHIVGACHPSYLRGTLMPALRRLGVEERVRFHGHQPASVVEERLSTASLLALPTLMDTAPNVLAEARAARVPVIASAVGGIPELVEDGVDGLLVPSGSAEALAAAMANVLRDPDAARRMGEEGRARVLKEHRPAVQVSKLLDVYRDIVSSASAVA